MTKVKNVYESLLDMIKYEQNFGAYYIYFALKKGYLQKRDRFEKLFDIHFTQAELEQIHFMEQ